MRNYYIFTYIENMEEPFYIFVHESDVQKASPLPYDFESLNSSLRTIADTDRYYPDGTPSTNLYSIMDVNKAIDKHKLNIVGEYCIYPL